MITLTQHEFDAAIEQAAEKGARKALASVGLHDDKALADMMLLRDLLGMYRTVRKSALAAFGQALMFALIGAALLYAGIKLNIGPKG